MPRYTSGVTRISNWADAIFTGHDLYIRTKLMCEPPDQDNILLYDSRSASKQIDRIRRYWSPVETNRYKRNRGERSYYTSNERNFSPQPGSPSFNCRRGRRSAIGTRFSGRFHRFSPKPWKISGRRISAVYGLHRRYTSNTYATLL